MKQQELNLQAMTNGNVKTVGDYSFEPIRGQPMLHWAGKRPFTSTQFYPAQEKERHGDEVNGWMNRIYWGDNLQVMSHLLKEFRGKVDLIYIDPESNTLRSYYPDFLAQKKDGSYVIIEVKGENMIDNAVVQAKARSAAELAEANAMTYEMIPSLKATYGLQQLHEAFL